MSPTLHTGDACKPFDASRGTPSATLVTIAGSAGAFYPLFEVLSSLPATLESAVAVMLHTGPRSTLANALALRSRLIVQEATPGDVLRDGWVYVPPQGTHLIINPEGTTSVSRAAPVRRFRPSADWLFESAAASFRQRHIAVVLSGMLSDGARRIRAVKRAGGYVIAQSPLDAEYPDMPNAAIMTGCVDQVVARDCLVDVICDAVRRSNALCDDRAW